ncbi:hypothetical protein BG58_40915 [Caballeronia jiangsuensis]|nr:hypothetical protein BG58_40915 [Caballeronia jiangsuensis]
MIGVAVCSSISESQTSGRIQPVMQYLCSNWDQRKKANETTEKAVVEQQGVEGFKAWRNAQYEISSERLSRYRISQPYGQTYEVDY